MHIYTDCIPCILNMSLAAIRGATQGKDEKKIFKAILALPLLRGNEWRITSVEIVEEVMKIIIAETGMNDPFEAEKMRQNQRMMAALPALEQEVKNSRTPLLSAVKLAITGNGIDAMVSERPSDMTGRILGRLREISLGGENVRELLARLQRCRQLLYVGDNAGEIVMDKLLIQIIKTLYDLDVFYAVRSLPALNDATRQDAEAVGMEAVAQVVESGIEGPLPGTILSRCSREFQAVFRKSDFILSKGGGNYETLSEERVPGKPVTYMLLSKCPVYRRHFDTPIGQPILANTFME